MVEPTTFSEPNSPVAPSKSKIKNFFGPKQVSDFYIQLQDPHRIFGPGDRVQGKVLLTLNRPVDTLYLAISLYGQLKVSIGRDKTTSTFLRRRKILWGRCTSSQDSRSTEGDAESDSSKSSWSSETLQQGQHVFDFELELPQTSLPSSLEFGKGSISYTIRCKHQRPSGMLRKGQSVALMSVPVLDVIDIATTPSLKPKNVSSDVKGKRKEDSEVTKAMVEIEKGGYLRGDLLNVDVSISHHAPIKNMKGLIVTLYRLSRFMGEGTVPHSFRKDLVQSISPIIIDPQSLQYHLTARLRIPPDTFPTISNAPFCQFKYFVEVVMDLSVRSSVDAMLGISASFMLPGSEFYHVSSANELVETEAIRREKGVKTVQFEIVMGTVDSAAKLREQQKQEWRRLHWQRHGSQQYESSPSDFDNSFFLPSRNHVDQVFGIDPPMLAPDRGRSLSSDTQADSKQALQAREAALFPSQPVMSGDALHNMPSAPNFDGDDEQLLLSPNDSSLQVPGGLVAPTSEKEEEALRNRVGSPFDSIVGANEPTAPDEDLMYDPSGQRAHELPLYEPPSPRTSFRP